ncbi:MAG: hypothetical protein GJU76_13135 [Gallionella sp.]|jgi:hypothetical protein|nr:hypothetical protein [Gallionella sp.]
MRIEVSATAPTGWDAYVERHESATAYHRASAVDIGARAFKLRTSYLSAYEGQGLVGVLPLVEQ